MISRNHRIIIVGLIVLIATCLANALYALMTLLQPYNDKKCEQTLMSAWLWLFVMTIEEFTIIPFITISLILFVKRFIKRTVGLVVVASILFSLLWSVLGGFVIIDRQSCYWDDQTRWLAVVIITCLALFRHVCAGVVFLVCNNCSPNTIYYNLMNDSNDDVQGNEFQGNKFQRNETKGSENEFQGNETKGSENK